MQGCFAISISVKMNNNLDSRTVGVGKGVEVEKEGREDKDTREHLSWPSPFLN